MIRALEAIGPPAEPAAIALVKSEQDWGMRSEVCKLLGTIGSTACIPVLQEATRNKKDAFVVMAAEASLKKLQQSPMSDAEVQTALDQLKSTDPGSRRDAARRLAEAQVTSARRGAVARALGGGAHRSRRERAARGPGRIPRLGRPRERSALADCCKDPHGNLWRDGLVLLAKLDPGPRTTEILIGRMAEDYGHVGRLLRELGPAAEPGNPPGDPAVPDPRVRIESCKVLETIGTEASLPILLAAAARQGEGQVAAAADDALRGITERE